MEKVIGLITCNYSAKESSALTESRPRGVAAVLRPLPPR